MFLLDWFYGVLASLGLWQKEAKFLFLGLDNAGKTDLIRMLKRKRLEEFSTGQIKFEALDFGGLRRAQRILNDYYVKVDAVVYLVEIREHWRFSEIKKELDALLKDESLATVPILILGHRNWTILRWTSFLSTHRDKVNLENSHIPHYEQIVEEWMCNSMKLGNLTTGKGKVNLREGVRPLEIFVCSTYTGMDYEDGFKWLSQYIK